MPDQLMSRKASALYGALSAMGAVMLVAPLFFPLGELLAPGDFVGDGEDVGLVVELLLGLGGGLYIALPSALIGGFAGAAISGRRLGAGGAVGFTALAGAIAVCVMLVLSGGEIGSAGESAIAWLVPVILALVAGGLSVAFFNLFIGRPGFPGQRPLVHEPAPQH